MKTLAITTIFTICMVGVAQASITFDFEGVPFPAGPASIEAYMESIYNSDITVDNARVGDGIFAGPLGPDNYIQDAGFGEHWFSISFNEVPIISASFDWAVQLDSFYAEADGVEIFSAGWDLWDYGNSGTINFASPVTTLMFSNSGLGEIEVDNLTVKPIPVPGAILLGGIGVGIVGWLRRRRSL